MNKSRMIILFAAVFLGSCAKQNESSDAKKGVVYVKSDLTSLPSCQFHADCTNQNQNCVELVSTSDRRCYMIGGAGDYIGCTKGELILLSGDPEQFACY